MIHILWATIRPQMFLNMHKIWMDRADNKNITTHVCVNNKLDSDMVKKGLTKNDEVIIINSTRSGVCQPAYALSSSLSGDKDDIVIFASDDFMAPIGWSGYLIEKLKNRTGALLVNDGYQAIDFSNMAEPVFSIPIMTYDCLLKINKIIYNPVYTHLCSDAELFLNLKEMNLIIDDRLKDIDYVFEHHHWSSGKRNPDQNDQSYYSNFEKDKNTWEMRKKLSLEERLKVI